MPNPIRTAAEAQRPACCSERHTSSPYPGFPNGTSSRPWSAATACFRRHLQHQPGRPHPPAQSPPGEERQRHRADDLERRHDLDRRRGREVPRLKRLALTRHVRSNRPDLRQRRNSAHARQPPAQPVPGRNQPDHRHARNLHLLGVKQRLARSTTPSAAVSTLYAAIGRNDKNPHAGLLGDRRALHGRPRPRL